jgi:hypothetical protein
VGLLRTEHLHPNPGTRKGLSLHRRTRLLDPRPPLRRSLNRHPLAGDHRHAARRAIRSEGKCPVPVDLLLKPFPAHRLGVNIDPASHQARQLPLQFRQPPEVVESVRREIPAQFHRNIEIRILPRFTPRRRAEYRQGHHSRQLQLRLVFAKCRNRAFQIHLFQINNIRVTPAGIPRLSPVSTEPARSYSDLAKPHYRECNDKRSQPLDHLRTASGLLRATPVRARRNAW